MTTWSNKGVTHAVADVNKERRAIRTKCYIYSDVWPRDLTEDQLVTCIDCVADLENHRDVAAHQYAAEAIQERRGDIIRHCGYRHKHTVSADDTCMNCGYR